MKYNSDIICKAVLNNPEWVIDLVQNDNKQQALFVEKMFFADRGGEFTNSNGYDGTINGKKYEVKYTNYVKSNIYLRIQKCNDNKRGLFDYIAIIDGLNTKVFIIPHDEWYKRADFNYYDEFEWSSTYNKNTTRGQKINNTNLLLEYLEE